MSWRTVERPGQAGKRRDKLQRHYDEKFGMENWRISWQWEGKEIPYIEACYIYEEGYYADSIRREGLWKELACVARDVYDIEESDIRSGTEYLNQAGNAAHLQDIAIRRVMKRRNIAFHGSKLVQIRSHEGYWGRNLSPGRVPFHMPGKIVVPHLRGWWDYDSVEDFWQSNKILQVYEE